MVLNRRNGHQPAKRASFGRDKAGIAAVEFALILPFMLLLYFGSVEITQAICINRLVTLTANTVTNLVSQYTTISASTQMPDILNASVQVLAPNPSSGAKIVVSCITIDNQGKATVAWSQTLNGTARTAGQSITVPAALNIPNSNIVLGEATYAYSPVFDFLHIGPFNLHSSVYMAPRNATTINLAS